MGERILAGGGLLWRAAGDQREICLVHRPRYDDWSLPKGKLHSGERSLRGAVREVREETGLSPVVGHRLGTQEYELGADRKYVDYWAMTPGPGDFAANDEVDTLSWLPLPAALRRLSYDRDRSLVEAFGAAPVPTAMVLLVRHAKAGSRSRWTGEDDLRPLDATGRRQAEALRHTLRWFGPTAVRSAEPLRCVQTVAPLAVDLGLPVLPDPALSEETYGRDPDAALKAVLAAASGGGRTVLASQGGVIPGLLGTLSAEHGVPLGRKIPARKSGVWALSFLDTRLVAADYYPHLGD